MVFGWKKDIKRVHYQLSRSMVYPYATKEQLTSGKPYHFAEYPPDEFLRDYRQSREVITFSPFDEIKNWNEEKIRKEGKSLIKEVEEGKSVETSRALEILYHILKSKNLDLYGQAEHLLKRYRRKVELKKLKQQHQGKELKNTGSEAGVFEYVWLGACLGIHYLHSQNLQSLSTLLKVNDEVIAKAGKLNKKEQSVAALSLDSEKIGILKLKENLQIRPLKERLQKRKLKANNPTTIQNLGMIVQDKLRSRAYLQSLLEAGFKPEKVLILEQKEARNDALEKPIKNNKFFRDTEKVQETCQRVRIPYEVIAAGDFNMPQVVEALQKEKGKYYVFSGSGILQEEILSTGKKLIHVHPGIVPQYRGSTCFLYSLLAEGKCGATAFFMDAGIDTGKVILQREFLPPDEETDIDRVYDNYIRAQVLVEVVTKLVKEGTLEGREQKEEGETYYVIHPVLRVIAGVYYRGS